MIREIECKKFGSETVRKELKEDAMKSSENEEIRRITEVIVDTVSPIKVYLFGSFAYGNPQEDSDFDFYVVVPDDYGRSIDLKHKIRKGTRDLPQSRAFDLVANSQSEFAWRSKEPTLERKILREGKLLYEQSDSRVA